MNMKKMSIKKYAPIMIFGFLGTLPGCFGPAREEYMPRDTQQKQAIAGEKEEPAVVDDSEVVVAVGGKPLVTKKALEAEKRELIESNPQLQAMIALMDQTQLDRNLAEAMATRAIMEKYIKENGIDASDDYKSEYERMMKSVKDMLNAKHFTKHISVKVTDAEIKEFYEKNKENIPSLLISQGGVYAIGVPFTSELQAKEFVDKVHAAGDDINKAAEQANIADKVKDFKLVSAQSVGLDNRLREKIIQISKCPTIQMFKIDDDAFWVVSATSKQEPKYREFKDIKNELKPIIEKEKLMKEVETEIARLKKEYDVKVSDEYFGANQEQAPEVLPEQEPESAEEPRPAQAA